MKNTKTEIKNWNKNNEKDSTPTSQQMSDLIHLLPRYEHHYERFPYVFNSIVSMNGNIIDKQAYHVEASSHKVIYNGNVTIVILEDGSKGVSKRNPNDKYDKYTGHSIAIKRARIAQLKKELKELTK